MRPAPPILEEDRRLLIEHVRPLFESGPDSRVFITGGTGFVGSWILEALTSVHSALAPGLSVTVLTRNPDAFRDRSPHLADHPMVHLLAGDVQNFLIPPEPLHYVIHAAFDSSREPSAEETRSTIVDGTARCLSLAQRARARRFLFVSSGAVYGKQPPEMENVAEDYADEPSLTGARTAYGEAKYSAERMVLAAGRDLGFEAVVARGFAFVGAHLPFEGHFAIGNFIRDASAGGPIRVLGDGSPIRSYLYAADLAIWLLTILFSGRSGTAYNVGSETQISVGDLARLVADTIEPGLSVEFARPPCGTAPERYVPSTLKARTELRLAENVELREAIRRTAAWHRSF